MLSFGLVTFYDKSNYYFYNVPFFIINGYKRDIEIVMYFNNEISNDDPLQLTHSGIFMTNVGSLEDIIDWTSIGDLYIPFFADANNQRNFYVYLPEEQLPPQDERVNNITDILSPPIPGISLTYEYQSLETALATLGNPILQIANFYFNMRNRNIIRLISSFPFVKQPQNTSTSIKNKIQYQGLYYDVEQKTLLTKVDDLFNINANNKTILFAQLYEHYSDENKKAMLLFLPYNTVCIQFFSLVKTGNSYIISGHIAPILPNNLYEQENNPTEIGIEGRTLMLYLSAAGNMYRITEYPTYNWLENKKYNIHQEPFVSTGFSGFYYEQRNVEVATSVNSIKEPNRFFYFTKRWGSSGYPASQNLRIQGGQNQLVQTEQSLENEKIAVNKSENDKQIVKDKAEEPNDKQIIKDKIEETKDLKK